MSFYRDDMPDHESDDAVPSLTVGGLGTHHDVLHSLRGFAAILVALACTQARTDDRQVSFDRDVMAVLSKAGCNMGACHGNRAGKGGLQLSLRGQDSASDYERLTREFAGRRINIQEPAASLILLKPSGGLAHEGGVRFDTDSVEYATLLDWLEAGATRDVGQASLANLTATPSEIVIEDPQQDVQLKVTAVFADGEHRDVTQLACYELSNLVAEVEPNGLVRRTQHGETTVLARYLNLQVPVRIAFVARPQATDLPYPDPVNFIDELIDKKLKSLYITPSQLCTDAEFVRRAFLDATGLMPTGREAQAFVADQQPDKRARLIDQLLERKEFAELWALRLGDLLRNEEKVLDPNGVKAFHAWLRDNIAEDQPLHHVIRAMLVGLGSTYENAPANFYRAHRTPSLRAETAARLFLGVRLECAKCHNHPFDRWTQDDYYSWTAWFAGIDYEIVENKRKDKLDKNEFRGEQIVKLKEDAEIKNPSTGKVHSQTTRSRNARHLEGRESIGRGGRLGGQPREHAVCSDPSELRLVPRHGARLGGTHR